MKKLVFTMTMAVAVTAFAGSHWTFAGGPDISAVLRGNAPGQNAQDLLANPACNPAACAATCPSAASCGMQQPAAPQPPAPTAVPGMCPCPAHSPQMSGPAARCICGPGCCAMPQCQPGCACPCVSPQMRGPACCATMAPARGGCAFSCGAAQMRGPAAGCICGPGCCAMPQCQPGCACPCVSPQMHGPACCATMAPARGGCAFPCSGPQMRGQATACPCGPGCCTVAGAPAAPTRQGPPALRRPPLRDPAAASATAQPRPGPALQRPVVKPAGPPACGVPGGRTGCRAQRACGQRG